MAAQAEIHHGVAVRDPMLPTRWRIGRRRRELSDVFTLELEPLDEPLTRPWAPGQFNMLYVFGAGEVAISVSGDPAVQAQLVHTVRAVGPATQLMSRLRAGDPLGVRGPFGSAWPVAAAEGDDLVFVAGGLGLAPLRPAIFHALRNRARYGAVCLYFGARRPEDLLFRRQLEQWRGRFDLEVEVTVDHAASHWAGPVGVVTKLIERGNFDPGSTTAFVCGPEVMMRFAAVELAGRGVNGEKIHLSMERNMKCAIGFCGHCQWGPHFVCKDGPVFPYARIADLLTIPEL
jgi:NAD(P)H-flavin reductase